MTCHGRLALAACLLLAVTLLPPPPQAHGFAPGIHGDILRRALPPLANGTGVDRLALDEIIGTMLLGQGNRGSELWHMTDETRHLDNASSPAEVCTRVDGAWRNFVNAFDPAIRVVPPLNYVPDGGTARSAFGALTHAVQDFYSHSNWIELAVAQNSTPGVAPIFPGCDHNALPAGLQTGYFKLGMLSDFGGCPLRPPLLRDSAPRPPFKYCHYPPSADGWGGRLGGLNKDSEWFGRGGVPLVHGAETVPGLPGVTYHRLAADLAVQHTIKIYQVVRERAASSVATETHDTSGACVAGSVFEVAYRRSCLDITGYWDGLTADGYWFLALRQQDRTTLSGSTFSTHCAETLSLTRIESDDVFQGTWQSCTYGADGTYIPECGIGSVPVSIRYLRRGVISVSFTRIFTEFTPGTPGCWEVDRQNVSSELGRQLRSQPRAKPKVAHPVTATARRGP